MTVHGHWMGDKNMDSLTTTTIDIKLPDLLTMLDMSIGTEHRRQKGVRLTYAGLQHDSNTIRIQLELKENL